MYLARLLVKTGDIKGAISESQNDEVMKGVSALITNYVSAKRHSIIKRVKNWIGQ